MTRPLLFDSVSDFSEGLAMVRLDSRLGYIDPQGELVITVTDAAVSLTSAYAQSLAVARAGDYY